MEAAKAWNRCRDAQQSAMKERTKWPVRDMLQKLTKGIFGLYSQSAQMVCHAFLANVEATVQLRKQGRKNIRYRTRKSGFIRCCGQLRR
jgi:putative transposase